MIDLFCLFALSPRSHIKASVSVLHNQRITNEAEAKRLFVQRFYFSLPPSLSLPSEQRVSVATSHPRPLHPDWQMQCQTFWSRTHLPLLLHSPGQPSVNTSCTRQTAEQVRTRKSRDGEVVEEEEEEGRETRAEGAFKSGQGQRRDKNDIRQYWVNIQYDTPLTGLGGCGEGVRSYCRFTWVSGVKCVGQKRGNLLSCVLLKGQLESNPHGTVC